LAQTRRHISWQKKFSRRAFDIAETGAGSFVRHVAKRWSADSLYFNANDPEDDTDSGWWFRCSSDEHDPADEVVMDRFARLSKLDPTVLPLLETRARRCLEPGIGGIAVDG